MSSIKNIDIRVYIRAISFDDIAAGFMCLLVWWCCFFGGAYGAYLSSDAC